MEFAKQLLNKHTKLGRAVRTGLQVVLAVLTAALGLLAGPWFSAKHGPVCYLERCYQLRLERSRGPIQSFLR